MARLGQHKAWDTMPSSGEHIKQVVLGSGMLNLVGIKVKALPPELSFQFQAEVFGAQALLIGVITQGVKHEIYVCVCVYIYIYIIYMYVCASHTHSAHIYIHTHTVKVESLPPATTGELKQ